MSREIFEIARTGLDVDVCETRDGRRPRYRRQRYGSVEDADRYVEAQTKRRLRAGFQPAGPCVLLGVAADDPRPASVLALDELFAAGDPRALDEILGTTAEKKLQSLARPWLADARPAMRRALLDYVSDGCDRPGHRALVKAIFKHAEANADDELMVHLAVAFDRLTHRIPTAQRAWQDGRMVLTDLLFASNPSVPDRAGGRLANGVVPTSRFSRRTRRYVARRAFRYLRRIGRTDKTRYGRLVRMLLPLYRDEHLASPERLLDSWTLVHVLYAWSDVLVRDPRGIRVAKGRTLGELAPAPYWPDALRDTRDELFAVLATARSRTVRAWTVAWLEKEYASELVGLPPSVVTPLLASADEGVARFGARLLRTAAGLELLPVDAWLALLSVSDLDALAIVVELLEAHVSPRRISLEACAALARSPAAVVAELALRWAEEKTITRAEHVHVVAMTRATVTSVRVAAATWALRLGLSPEHLRDLFDARHEDVRALAARFAEENAAARSLPLWFALVESPYDDVRALVLRHATEWEKEAGASEVEHLAATALLAIHRGSATKQVVLRRLAERSVARPEEVDRLLPLLALALRSVRAPERTSALASLARAAVASDIVRAALARHLPELAVGTQVSA